MDLECWSQPRQESEFFSDLESESKFCVKLDLDPELLVIFGSSKSLYGLYTCHFLSENIAELQMH